MEADLLPAARTLDENHPTPPDGFLITVPGIKAMLAALDNHYKTVGGFAGLDAYLTSLNGATGMTFDAPGPRPLQEIPKDDHRAQCLRSR